MDDRHGYDDMMPEVWWSKLIRWIAMIAFLVLAAYTGWTMVFDRLAPKKEDKPEVYGYSRPESHPLITPINGKLDGLEVKMEKELKESQYLHIHLMVRDSETGLYADRYPTCVIAPGYSSCNDYVNSVLVGPKDKISIKVVPHLINIKDLKGLWTARFTPNGKTEPTVLVSDKVPGSIWITSGRE